MAHFTRENRSHSTARPALIAFFMSANAFFTAKTELRAAILAGILLLLGFIAHTLLQQPWGVAFTWTSLAIGLVFGGRPAIEAVRHGKLDIDVLMIVAAVLAAVINHPSEGALLLFLFVLSGALEDLAMQRTTREVEALHKLMPADALVLRNGEWINADAKTLVTGDIVKIRPGERVPADAVVTVGETSFDQSAITGESLPRHVAPNDELFAGTINTDDAIEARVLRPVRESSLQKILDMVISAREQREPVQQVIDRLEQPYTIFVFALSLAVLLVWWKVFGVPLLGPVDDAGKTIFERGAIYTAITLLVVASPCALVIATPTATLAAIARGARDGVLFKGGQSLERLANIAAVCFDKTGTLTFGKPRLFEIKAVAWSEPNELLAIAAALEQDSTHPIASAIRDAAEQRGIAPAILTEVNHTTAKGLQGVHDGTPVRLGRYDFVEPLIPACFRNHVREILGNVQHQGHIAVVVAKGHEQQSAAEVDTSCALGQVAVLMMADAVRPGAETLVAELHALNIKPVRMLTGDNKATAARIAEQLHLDAFDAELLPQDKLTAISAMKVEAKSRPGKRHGVAMIGDGVNDAPSLAAADVALGIGTIGTAAALESADIVLLSDNLGTIPWAVRVARRGRQTVVINLSIALGVMVLMGLATLIGSRVSRPIPLSVGVLAHEGGTLLVVLNSLILLRFGSPKPAQSTNAIPPKAIVEKTEEI